MRKTCLALIASLLFAAGPARAEAMAVKPVAASTTPRAASSGHTPRVITIPRTASTPTLSEEERYAVREAISKEAKNFRGGDAIVITATAAIIILLGVIIIILLT